MARLDVVLGQCRDDLPRRDAAVRCEQRRREPAVAAHVFRLGRKLQRQAVQRITVAIMDGALLRHTLLEHLHLPAADAGADIAHAVVVAELGVLVPRDRFTRLRSHLQRVLRIRLIPADERAAAGGRDDLVAVERQHAVVPERAAFLPVVHRAERLGRILDEQNAVRITQAADGVELAGHTVEVHGDERLRRTEARDGRLNGLGVEIPGVGLGVEKHRLAALIDDRVCRGRKRQALAKDPVAALHPREPHRQMQRRRTGGQRRDIARTEVLLQILLEARDVRAERRDPVCIERQIHIPALAAAHMRRGKIDSLRHHDISFMVPTSLIKKMYGKSVIAEVVNKALQEAVYNYIKENKVNMLGEPLPNEEKQQNIDFDTMDEFDFVFDIALAPEFKAEVSTKDKVDYYTIEVSDEMIDNQVKMYTQRTGKYDKVDAYEDNDMLKGLLAQLDEEGNTKEGGIQVEGAVLMPSYMKNDDQKAIFANAKVNDVLVFNPNVAYDGHAAELGSLLKIDKEIAKDVKSNFSFQVEEITRFVPGELTQEVFDQAFGEGVVKTEEEFRAKIKEEIAARFVADSDYKFLIDVRKVLMDKVGKLEFPDALLKRIMLLNNEEKGEEYVAENYDKSIEELTWHLIKEQLVEANDIKVEQEDVLKMARETTKAQFAQYGMLSIPDDVLDNYAQEMLKKKETINNLVSRVVEVKLAAALKAQVTLENKNVSIEEFNKMFE